MEKSLVVQIAAVVPMDDAAKEALAEGKGNRNFSSSKVDTSFSATILGLAFRKNWIKPEGMNKDALAKSEWEKCKAAGTLNEFQYKGKKAKYIEYFVITTTRGDVGVASLFPSAFEPALDEKIKVKNDTGEEEEVNVWTFAKDWGPESDFWTPETVNLDDFVSRILPNLIGKTIKCVANCVWQSGDYESKYRKFDIE